MHGWLWGLPTLHCVQEKQQLLKDPQPFLRRGLVLTRAPRTALGQLMAGIHSQLLRFEDSPCPKRGSPFTGSTFIAFPFPCLPVVIFMAPDAAASLVSASSLPSFGRLLVVMYSGG